LLEVKDSIQTFAEIGLSEPIYSLRSFWYRAGKAKGASLVAGTYQWPTSVA
jgi:hypothetical protein